MSPEYRNIHSVPADLKQLLRSEVDHLQLNYASLVNTGVLFLVNDGKITRLLSRPGASESVVAAAKKKISPWHSVNGLQNPQARTTELGRRFGNHDLSNARRTRGGRS